MAGPYPLSQGYLEMQLRRRGNPPPEASSKVIPIRKNKDPKLY